MTFRFSIIVSIALAAPAIAQDQPPPNLATEGQGSAGGVARLVLSHHLYALGRANKDPLTVLNAARLAASVTLSDTQRAHDTSGDPVQIGVSNTADPAEMFGVATTLAAENEPLLDLIDASRRELNFTPLATAISTVSTLAAGQTDAWPQPFYGASLAEIAILGDENSNLDLKVMDENGNLVCLDIGPSDTAYCSFYPAQNGSFLINVGNTGTGANSYLLLTN